jgi:hypothetical protein
VSLSRRLLAGSLLVIGVLVTLVVLSLDWRLSVRLRDDTTAELLREAQLVATSWQADIDPDALANRAGAALGHRVTLIGADGVVLGMSSTNRHWGRSRTIAPAPRSSPPWIAASGPRFARRRPPVTRSSTRPGEVTWGSSASPSRRRPSA